MASIHKEMVIAATPERIWDAVRDVGEIHRRLVPGFVVDCKLEAGARLVTFGNGMVAREVIVDVDDQHRRHVWNTASENLKHHNASIQVFAEGADNSRVVWIVDLLPNELAPTIAGMVDLGLAAMKKTLEQIPE